MTFIPPSFWSLKDILQINLSSNYLSGHLPSDVGNLEHVTYIDLSWNQLSGNIPAFRDLVLENLSLAHNKFQGPIPCSFDKLISMVHLDLYDNNLSREIPMSLVELKGLKYFNVSFNRLQGEIPFTGVIAQFSAQSFMGNKALYGLSKLQVPPCKTSNAGQSRTSTAIIVRYILPTMIAIILALVLLFALMRHRKR